mgnify:CR=1 FL=1
MHVEAIFDWEDDEDSRAVASLNWPHNALDTVEFVAVAPTKEMRERGEALIGHQVNLRPLDAIE